jgi:SpoIID/LytB domain protein
MAIGGAMLIGSSAVLVALPSPASAYPSASVSFQGHGYGHGAGMGQWGALGYALAGGSYQSILGHYYGGTSLTSLSGGQEATQVHVAMTVNNGNTVIVTSGSIFSVGSLSVPAGSAVLMSPTGSAWNLYVSSSCAGGAGWGNPVAAGVVNPIATPAVDPGVGDPNTANEALQLCQGPGNITMRGDIEATYNSNGATRTINIVPLEEYVSGVVPNESPAGWGTLGGAGAQGQAWGFQELEAQAVAVRSYVMAGLGSYAAYANGAYADTCDLVCQTYRGTLNENGLTDLATGATLGQVMEFPSGAVAATQYSSSNGGYSAGGTFPAVADTGDSVCVPGACNPNHTWTASIAVSTIDATWPQLGVLQSIAIPSRNGLGDWGGRVTAMTLIGSNQSVSMTGAQFADAVGLKSDWFTTTTSLTAPAVGLATTHDGQGYWEVGTDGGIYSFGDAAFQGSASSAPLNRPVVGMAATPDGGGYWLAATDGGIFSYGDAAFYASMGNIRLNKPVVGMASTPDGHGYWMVATDGGIFTFGDAGFYGSTGSMHLNKPVVGMAATPDGGGYWLVASDGGIFTFGDAAFYGSTGNIHLNKPVVGMASTPDGHGYWLVASDGGIFTFGDASFYGSTGNIALNKPVVGMASTPSGHGYWLVASDGGLFTFGDAPFFGSAAG